MKNLELISAWSLKKGADNYIYRHTHDYHEVVYYVSANGKTDIGGVKHDFTSGSFAFIPVGTEHDEYHVAESHMICVIFKGMVDLPAGVCQDKDRQLFHVLGSILSETTEQRSGYEDMLAAKLCEMNVLITRFSDKTSGINTAKDFSYAMSYIRENIDEKDVLRKASEGFYQSYDYFRHCFKAQTGFSPREYLMICRFDTAKQLLRQTKLSCTEISYRCGFCSGAQFASMFKDKFGCTPSDYRSQSQSDD